MIFHNMILIHTYLIYNYYFQKKKKREKKNITTTMQTILFLQMRRGALCLNKLDSWLQKKREKRLAREKQIDNLGEKSRKEQKMKSSRPKRLLERRFAPLAEQR